MQELTEPLVSVVVGAYNVRRYIAATIDGVVGQTFGGWELVIIDDGSTDDTAAIAGARAAVDSRIRLLSFPNGGASVARNRGIDSADPRAPFIVFLDSDDVLEPDALQLLLNALQAHPDAPAVHGAVMFIDAEGKPIASGAAEQVSRRRRGVRQGRLMPRDTTAPTGFLELVYRNCIFNGGQMLIRKAAIDKTGGFDRTLLGNEDWELWMRLSRLGDMPYVDRVVLRYRRHGTGLSSRERFMRGFELNVRQRLRDLPDLDDEERQAVRLGFRYSERTSAAMWAGLAWRDMKKFKLISAAKSVRRSLLFLAGAVTGRPFFFGRPDRAKAASRGTS